MDNNAIYEDKSFLGHPKGLFYLFFTELWERFSFYGMRAILILFVVASTLEGGLGWSQGDALALYGWYTMFVYVSGIPGGWLADNVFGQRKAVMIGGGLLVAGHGVMAIPQEWAFFTALVLIIMGVGLLKPNISSMVGGLYRQGDIRRDKGFTLFYMGINIGAFTASLAVPFLAMEYGWHYGFGLAGIGMLIGQLLYISGQKHLAHVGGLDHKQSKDGAMAEADKPLTKIEKDRIVVLLLSFLIVIVFWGAFEQAGGLMNLFRAVQNRPLYRLCRLDSTRRLVSVAERLVHYYFWADSSGFLGQQSIEGQRNFYHFETRHRYHYYGCRLFVYECSSGREPAFA